MYKLTVIKYEDNPTYKEELAKWNADRNNRYGPHMDDMGPQPQKAVRSLEVVLDEFNAVKAAAVAAFV